MSSYFDPLTIIAVFAVLAVTALIAAATIYIKQSEIAESQRKMSETQIKMAIQMEIVIRSTSNLTQSVQALAEIVEGCAIRRKCEEDLHG